MHPNMADAPVILRLIYWDTMVVYDNCQCELQPILADDSGTNASGVLVLSRSSQSVIS